LPRQFHIGGLAPRLPMDEVMFSHLNTTDDIVDVTNWQPGIWSHSMSIFSVVCMKFYDTTHGASLMALYLLINIRC